jgi:hypothetical protein
MPTPESWYQHARQALDREQRQPLPMWEGCGYGTTPAEEFCYECRYAEACRWWEWNVKESG